ncbi:MAG: anaerobic ribonucleoside-triphosphate reductase [Promethearchaeota archaeon]
MSSDKNQNNLEKHLKTLGQKVRIDILRKLKNCQSPLTFSRIQKDVLGDNSSTVNLSFHLNTLKKSNLVSSSEEGYSITSLGEQIIEKIISIEKILNTQSNIRMIRTSKYSKEKFDMSKIEDYLVDEGELERYLARQIAHEVEERLSKTNIDYMTAPLMREYINAILLENGLEEVRHKLTRLGTPPFEAFKLFNSKNNEITPKKFIEKLGSDVSEQFLLLNLLPKNLADLYLSGEIALLNLNYWALRPLGLYLNTKMLIEYINNKDSISQNFENFKNHTNLILNFSDLLYGIKEFYSENLVLGNFNQYFLSYFKKSSAEHLLSILISQILRFNKLFNDKKPSLSLDFNYNRKNSNLFSEIDNLFFGLLKNQSKGFPKPSISLECSDISSPELTNNFELFSDNFIKNSFIFYHNSYSNLVNPNIISIPSHDTNFIILDKILVNLHMISLEARQNDDLFFECLQKKLDYIFQFFTIKEELVKKKLNSLKKWENLAKNLFNEKVEELFKNSLRSISFFGLNEAILNHCGIELDRLESSEAFAVKSISFMNKIISERKEQDPVNYFLSQPHDGTYLRSLMNNENGHHNQITHNYCSGLIRSDSNLSFDKKISLFKKFQKNINGGTLFIEKISEEQTIQELLKKLFQSEIGTISLK